MNKKNKKKKKTLSKLISLVLLIILVALFVMIIMFDIVPIIYVGIALLIMLLIYMVLLKLNFSRRKPKRSIGLIFSSILILFFLLVDVYLAQTLDVFNGILNTSKKIETYNVLVLKDTKYEELKDIDGELVGVKEINDNPGLDKAKAKISKIVDIDYEEYESITEVEASLSDESVEAIILEDAELDILKEENPSLYDEFRVIYELEISIGVKDVAKNVNILKKPFNIYISGVDTFGKINSATRSDVNILMTVNPKTEKIHITWVPRDYYVKINDSTYKDKLTHAGIYGIESSIFAMENILDTEVNYYAKVNFTSVIKIVDALDGISVYNDQSFTSQDGFYYKKCEITMDGKHALSFVRERKNVSGGDMGRGNNQVKVLKALIEKMKSPKIITKYMSILNAMDGSFNTNIDINDVTKYIEREIKHPKDYDITSYTLDGKTGYDYTYSYRKNKLSVIFPDEESVSKAKNEINKVLGVEN